MFRIPIGDYRLQLDYRIHAALSLLSVQESVLLCPRKLAWRISQIQERPLAAILSSIGLSDGEYALRVSYMDFALVEAIVYLVNRWGTSKDSLYVIPENKPSQFLYCPGSRESVFVQNRTLTIHNSAVDYLRSKSIPAYGPHVVDPIPEPTYQDIVIGASIVRVDRSTGKPIGPGSDESVLLPEYLRPCRFLCGNG
jgi:hypothetical protein